MYDILGIFLNEFTKKATIPNKEIEEERRAVVSIKPQVISSFEGSNFLYGLNQPLSAANTITLPELTLAQLDVKGYFPTADTYLVTQSCINCGKQLDNLRLSSKCNQCLSGIN